MVSSREEEVGICERLGDSKDLFDGIVKFRWDDFHVHEVDRNGTVLHLTELLDKRELVKVSQEQRAVETGQDVLVPEFEFTPRIAAALREEAFLTEQCIQNLRTFIRLLGHVEASLTMRPTQVAAKGQPAEDTSTPNQTAEYISECATSESFKNSIPPSETLALDTTIATGSRPPHCLVLGDFQRCFRHESTKNETGDNTCKLSENDVWKSLRRAVHTGLRKYLPFLCSETLSVHDLASSLDVAVSELRTIHVPLKGVIPGKIDATEALNQPASHLLEANNTKVGSFKRELDETGSLIPSGVPGQEERVIRVCPKPQCLTRLLKRSARCDKINNRLGKSEPSNDDARISDHTGDDDPIVQGGENFNEQNKNVCSCSNGSNRQRTYQNRGRGRQARGRKGRRNNGREATNDRDEICTTCGKMRKIVPHIGVDRSFYDRWPKDRPPFLQFRMWKANRDSQEAVGMIARTVGCNVKAFSIAGTKDRRGITVQNVTAAKITKETILRGLLRPTWDNNVRLSNFEYVQDRLKLGDLQGNRFKVCIRNIPSDAKSSVDRRFTSLKDVGFINYFGLQRFGTRHVRTHRIGIALLQENYDVAVRLILGDANPPPAKVATATVSSTASNDDNSHLLLDALASTAAKAGDTTTDMSAVADTVPTNLEDKQWEHQSKRRRLSTENRLTPPSAHDVNSALPEPECAGSSPAVINSPPDRYSAKNTANPCQPYLDSGDITSALQNLPRQAYVERVLLEKLLRTGGRSLDALKALPKNLLTLYVHAVQSVLWNFAASTRIADFGLRVVIGDLVRKRENLPDRSNCLTKSFSDLRGCEEQEGLDDCPPELNPEDETDISTADSAIHEVKTEAEAAQYHITDVVLPIPGDDVIVPANLLEAYERICRSKLNLELADIKSNRKHWIGQFKGGYRYLVAKPANVEWTFIPNLPFVVDPKAATPLIQSDVTRLLKEKVENQTEVADSAVPESPPQEGQREQQDQSCSCAAVVFECTLPKSTYVTMACRELLQTVD